jgi:hypothetical protein
MRLTLDSKPRFTPSSAPNESFPSSPFPMTDHSPSVFIDHLGASFTHIGTALPCYNIAIETSCNLLPQSSNAKQSRESSPVDIRAPSPSHQSWQTNQEALPYGIDPRGHSATGALPFSNISQRQLKVSLMCRRGTVLAAPWRPPTTFQILCIAFPFSATPRTPGNSSPRRFQYTFPNPSGLRFYIAI